MKGYKAFSLELQCRGFQFEIGKEYKHDGEIRLCGAGFHYCRDVADCFDFYPMDSSRTRVCEIEDLGTPEHSSDKSVTNHIRIVREISWQEMLTLANTGKDNTGRLNSGNRNSGYGNSGDGNSGNRNSGYGNSGDGNSGDGNSGYGNSGDGNSGDYNSGNGQTGFFNTDTATVRMFNKDTGLTRDQVEIPYINLQVSEWIPDYLMTDEQKKADPHFHVKCGTLIRRSYKEAWALAWAEASEATKRAFLELPNFDAKIFEEITGIKVDQPKKARKKKGTKS